MIVMKFGGTSVGDAAHIREVGKIILAQKDRKPVVVVSAHKGVTDLLQDTAREAVRGKYDLQAVRGIHQAILRELDLPEDIHEDYFQEMDDLLRGITLVGELTLRSLDYVLSFGERMSCRTLAQYLRKEGYEAEGVDAFDLGLLTDSRFGGARPLPQCYAEIKKSLSKYKGIPVVTGYIAKDTVGNITTLGRNGSDYSAAIFGNAIDAEEIQIWTDVDGVMTADPRIVNDARPIGKISFDEASELSYYGGRVLHPNAILPAVEKKIPVRVLNTRNPDGNGTVIVSESEKSDNPVRAIVYKKDIQLINVTTARMLGQPGFMAKLFAVFDRYEIVIDMIATTEVSVSMTTESTRHLQEAIGELQTFADVSVETGAIVCVVGHGIKQAYEVPGVVFSTLAKAGIRVRMVSQGALQVNVGFLVGNEDVNPAVQALHRAFFG